MNFLVPWRTKTEHAKRDCESYRVGVRVGLTEKVKFEQRFEGKGMNHTDI